MLNIAIVEDDNNWAAQLEEYLVRFGQEEGEQFSVRVWNSGFSFLESVQMSFDIIFLDIEMPHFSGMETARQIRKYDQNVCLIFITNMTQYAIEGFEVNAWDYMVKPVAYEVFRQHLVRAMTYCKKHHQKESIVLFSSGGFQKLEVNDIYYIEVSGHSLIYHTVFCDFTEVRKPLKDREQELEPFHFSRCNNYVLVNLQHVVALKSNDLTLTNGTVLQISRSKRRKCLLQLANYMGNNL